jgi:cold-inducible RNA-binding protein
VGKTVYVGNLPYSMDDNGLCDWFTEQGVQVEKARVVTDKESQRSKGFGFIDLVDESMLADVVTKFDRADCGGRMLRVSEAVNNAGSRRDGGRRDDRRDDRGPDRGPYRGPRRDEANT